MRATGRSRRVALLAALVGAVALVLPMPAANADQPTVAPAVTAAATSRPLAGPAATDYSSIFAAEDPALEGAGWAGCETPVTWTVDLGALDPAHAAAALADLAWAFDQWADASGLTFSFTGEAALAYDDAAFALTPADGSAAPTRNIAVAFVDDADTDRMGGQTVGLGSPAQVVPTTNEIVVGTAVFRTDHAMNATSAEARSLYLHELGHVLGLAHAHDDANIMFPVVGEQLDLGPGDVNGVRSLEKACAS